MSISTAGTLVNSSVTTGQSTVSITTINVGDFVVANLVVYGNIQITGVSGGNVASWSESSGPSFNSTLAATVHQWVGTVNATGAATVTFTFSGTIGTTKVQRTIQQLTAGIGAGCEWHWGAAAALTNASSTTLTFPSLTASFSNIGYFPYVPNGAQATTTGVSPIAYVGYCVNASTGSAGSTSGFGYTVDANGEVLALDLGVTQNSTVSATASQATAGVSVSQALIVMPNLSGTTFLTQSASGLRLALEIAWGANLTDTTGASWNWTDVTGDVLMDPGSSSEKISVTLGSPNDTPGQQTSASQMVATLLNAAAQYSLGGQSSNYPNVTRNVPVRLRVFAGGSWLVEYQGGAVSFQPTWDETGKWATVVMTASGPLRRLNQGTLRGISAMYQGTIADTTVQAYWPCEDGPLTTVVAAAIGSNNGTYGTFDYSTSTIIPGVAGSAASYNDIPATNAILTLKDGGELNCQVSSPFIGTTASCTSALFGNINSVKVGDGTTLNQTTQHPQVGALMTVYTPNGGSIKAWEIVTLTSGALQVIGYAASLHTYGSNVFSTGVAYNLDPNTPYEIGLNLTQSGSTTTYSVWVLNVNAGVSSQFTGTHANAGTNVVAVQEVQLGTYSDSGGLACGHIIIRNANMAGGHDAFWASGYNGETVMARMFRIAALENIPLNFLTVDPSVGETSNNPLDVMGPQHSDTTANLLREAEATGQGMLLDGLDPGLTYVDRWSREGQQPAVTLDADLGHLSSFEPVDDDQNVVNDVQVTRRGGNTYIYQQLTGARGINAIGDYQNSVTVNPSSDSALTDLAEWLVNLGTPDGYRYPSLQVALEFHPALIPSFLALLPAHRLDVLNVADLRTQMQKSTVKNMVLGWTEQIDLYTWHVDFNCTSYDPWRVITLAAATGSTNDTTCWLDTDGSQLAAAATQGATSISVTVTAGPRWVTTADTGGSDNFPFSINLGGYQVQVTNVTGTTNPQTFTVAALPAAFSAGTTLSIWNPPILGV